MTEQYIVLPANIFITSLWEENKLKTRFPKEGLSLLNSIWKGCDGNELGQAERFLFIIYFQQIHLQFSVVMLDCETSWD